MTVVPLIERELQVQARRKGIYWLRFGVGLAAVLVCLPGLLLTQAPNEVGKALFNAVSISAFILCCAGCLLTSDSIAVELREGTLGLLVLTRVRLIEIVTGKLAANALPAFMVLAAMLPLLMVPLLSGGVTVGEAFRKGLVLLVTLFLSLVVGLYSSVSMRERFPAVRRSAGWLSLVIGVPALINMLLVHSSVTIGMLSPIWAMILAGDVKYAAAPMRFWISLVLIQSIGLCFLLRTSVALRRTMAEQSAPMPLLPAILRRHFWHGLGVTAAYWVASRQQGFKPIVWAAVLLAAIFHTAYSWLAPSLWSLGLLGVWLPGFIFSLGSSILLAWGASRALIESRQTGELELLLTTPLGVSTLLKAHWLFHKRALRWPLAVLGLTLLLPFVFALLSHGQPGFSHLAHYAIWYGLGFMSTLLGFAALCQAGLWFGFTAPTQGRAILSTVLVVKGIPFALTFFNWTLSVSGFAITRTFPIGLLPTIITIAFYLWVIRKTREKISRFKP